MEGAALAGAGQRDRPRKGGKRTKASKAQELFEEEVTHYLLILRANTPLGVLIANAAYCCDIVASSAIFWLGVPKFGIQITRTLLKKSSISAESSRRDTSKSEVFSVLGALACTHDLPKARSKCHYGVFFAAGGPAGIQFEFVGASRFCPTPISA